MINNSGKGGEPGVSQAVTFTGRNRSISREFIGDGECGRNLHIALVRQFLNGRVIRFANNIVHAYVVKYYHR